MVLNFLINLKTEIFMNFLIEARYRGQLKNHDISGALYTLRIQYTQTQCEDGARDVRVL